MNTQYPLNVPAPHHFTFAVRDIPEVTVEQRERALKATHYNEFAFPSGLLTVDMLSDSGTTAMTNQQWAALFLGDEAYGRNTGYYILLDTFRDIFERGGEKNWKKIIDLVRTDCRDVERMMDEVYLCEYEGGFFNGGAAQMERPNAFIIQQGRAAEIPPRATSSRWAPFHATFTIKSCCGRSRRAAAMRRTPSRATWTSKSWSSSLKAWGRRMCR